MLAVTRKTPGAVHLLPRSRTAAIAAAAAIAGSITTACVLTGNTPYGLYCKGRRWLARTQQQASEFEADEGEPWPADGFPALPPPRLQASRQISGLEATFNAASGQVVTATKSSQLMQLATEDDTAATHAVERAAQLFEDAQRSSRTLNALRQAAAAAAAAAGEVPLPEGLLAWPSIASTTEIRAAAPNAPDDAVAAALEVMYLEKATGSYKWHIIEELQSNVNLQRGSKNKPTALAAAAEAAGQAIVIGDRRMYYADIQLDSAAGQEQLSMSVKIGGRVDGWLEDRSAFVQVKNRQFKLHGVPVHERVQVLAYMQCTGVNRCLFLEKFKNSSSTAQLTWEQDWCKGLWQDCVLPGLWEYVQQLQELLRSTAAQDELLLTAYERGLIEW
ncbi:hypothetical protein OEZ86_009829 [Tetradesmus obliquus]|nr:hypothetical protein OEZ86_009829 [Tetradesmus obliquus]